MGVDACLELAPALVAKVRYDWREQDEHLDQQFVVLGRIVGRRFDALSFHENEISS